MLDRIKIEGFRSIKGLELDLAPINLLIGANGAGKSNFISFFKLVQVIFEQKLKNYTMTQSADRLLHYGRKHTQEIRGLFRFNLNTYDFTLQPREDETLFIAEEKSIYGSDVRFDRDLEESLVAVSDRYRDQYLRGYFRGCKVYHFHDTGSASPLRRREVDLYDNHSLAIDGGNLAAYLFWLSQEHPKTLSLIESTLRSVMPIFDRFVFPSNDQPQRNTVGIWWSNRAVLDASFSVKDFSDGSLRFLALATLFLQPHLPKVIIIDEPELGLHPRAISVLAGLIQSARDRGTQVIISTQSLALINLFEPSDVITVDMQDGVSVFKRLSSDNLASWLEDYSLGELWEMGVLDGQPRGV